MRFFKFKKPNKSSTSVIKNIFKNVFQSAKSPFSSMLKNKSIFVDRDKDLGSEMVILLNKEKIKNITYKFVIAIFLILTLMGRVSIFGNSKKKISKYNVARVKISGVIEDSYGTTYQAMLSGLKKNKLVKAVIIHIDTPGGSPAASESIWSTINSLKKEKPVLCYVPGVAASGGYYIASACSKIFAEKLSVIGSVGVIGVHSSFKELMSKVGIKSSIFRSAKHKASPTSSEEMTPELRSEREKLIQQIFKIFTDDIFASRKIEDKYKDIIKSGRVFMGFEAKKMNLIDEVGNEDLLIKHLEQHYKIAKPLVFNISLKVPKHVLLKQLTSQLEMSSYYGTHQNLMLM